MQTPPMQNHAFYHIHISRPHAWFEHFTFVWCHSNCQFNMAKRHSMAEALIIWCFQSEHQQQPPHQYQHQQSKIATAIEMAERWRQRKNRHTEKQQEFNFITHIRQIICPHSEQHPKNKNKTLLHVVLVQEMVLPSYQRWSTHIEMVFLHSYTPEQQAAQFLINHLHSQFNQWNVAGFFFVSTKWESNKCTILPKSASVK